MPLAHLLLNVVPPNPAAYAVALGGGVSVADGMVFANTGRQGSAGSVVAFKPA